MLAPTNQNSLPIQGQQTMLRMQVTPSGLRLYQFRLHMCESLNGVAADQNGYPDLRHLTCVGTTSASLTRGRLPCHPLLLLAAVTAASGSLLSRSFTCACAAERARSSPVRLIRVPLRCNKCLRIDSRSACRVHEEHPDWFNIHALETAIGGGIHSGRSSTASRGQLNRASSTAC